MLISEDGGRFAFDKHELAILTAMMAGDERETLAALWFHPSKAQAWATDGHRAVMVERDIKPPKAPAGARPVAIPAATAHHAAKTAKNRDLVVIDVSGEGVVIDVREWVGRGVEIEGFEQIDDQTRSRHTVTCKRHTSGPGSIEEFFPAPHARGKKGAAVSLDPKLMAPVVLLAKVSTKVWINLGKPTEPVTFVASADAWTVWRMLIMPRCGSGDAHPDLGRVSVEPARSSKGRSRSKGRRAKPGTKSAEPAATRQGRGSTEAVGQGSTAARSEPIAGLQVAS